MTRPHTSSGRSTLSQGTEAMEEEGDCADDGEDDEKENEPLRFWDLADDLDVEVEEEYDDEEEPDGDED